MTLKRYKRNMNITLTILADVNNDFEKDFINWVSVNENEHKRIKDAVLTGYFITEYGINDYYKKYFETDFKNICEAELTQQINKVKEDKLLTVSKLNGLLESTSTDYERKLESMSLMNNDLQKKLLNLTEQLKIDKETIKDETVGFYEEKSKREIELLQLENEAKIKELKFSLERALVELDDVKNKNNVSIEKDLKYINDKFEIEVRSLKEQNNALEEQMEYFKALATDKDVMLKDAFKNETKERMHTLENIIQQKDAELMTLKTCNFVKGFTGENIILSFLRETYPRHEIHHTGKVAHEGDIQMIDTKDDSLIVIESKYKQAIDKNDVEKFCRDVSTVCQKDGSVKCVGGIFVSLLTRNIPGKGDAHFEMIGNVPVMYVGFSNTDEFSVYFKKYIEMFNTLCKFYKAQGTTLSDVSEFIDEMNFYFNMLIKNKTRIEDFKSNCLTKLTKFVGDIETDNKMLLTRIEDILKKNNSLKYTNMHMCGKCGEAFSQKRLLTKHMKSCDVV